MGRYPLSAHASRIIEFNRKTYEKGGVSCDDVGLAVRIFFDTDHSLNFACTSPHLSKAPRRGTLARLLMGKAATPFASNTSLTRTPPVGNRVWENCHTRVVPVEFTVMQECYEYYYTSLVPRPSSPLSPIIIHPNYNRGGGEEGLGTRLRAPATFHPQNDARTAYS